MNYIMHERGMDVCFQIIKTQYHDKRSFMLNLKSCLRYADRNPANWQ